jgi:NAD(P)-dependent dehydrogenase (short-subunit alcohol dehydrogenase family)
VLGAAGLGYAAAETFRDAGWTVKGVVRPGRANAVPRRVEAIEAVTRDEAVAAARGCDVVLNAFNPVITEWQKNALSLAYAAITAPAVADLDIREDLELRPRHALGARRTHSDAN